MDRKKFFDAIRRSLYKTGLPQSAVTNAQIIIEKAALHNATAEELAYMLATARHEVGPDLVPKRESLNYHVNALVANFSRERISLADAQRLGRKAGEGPLPEGRQMQIANLVYGGEWGKSNLGNVKSGSGWLYRGGGYPQTTGARNYNEVGKLTGLDLINHPERIMEPAVAATALVVCMLAGTYTGKKLSDYSLPSQYFDARAIINADKNRVDGGVKIGTKIAGYADAFLVALKASGYSPASVRAQTDAETGGLVVDAPAARPVETPVKTDTPPAARDKEAGVIAGIVVGFIAAAVGVATWAGSTVCEWTGFFCGG